MGNNECNSQVISFTDSLEVYLVGLLTNQLLPLPVIELGGTCAAPNTNVSQSQPLEAMPSQLQSPKLIPLPPYSSGTAALPLLFQTPINKLHYSLGELKLNFLPTKP